MSYFPSISQNVTVDATNSETSFSLASAAIWHTGGLGGPTSGVNAIQIVVTSTRNLEIYVDQGLSTSSFQITDIYNYLTTKQFGITVQAVSAFVRVRAKNVSDASATVTITTVLCPIVEALPRSLEQATTNKPQPQRRQRSNSSTCRDDHAWSRIILPSTTFITSHVASKSVRPPKENS